MQLLDFKNLLKQAGMNKKDFSKIAKISYGTVNSWGVEGRAEVPEWVNPFLINSAAFKIINPSPLLPERESTT